MQNLSDLLARFKAIENPVEIKRKVKDSVERVLMFKMREDSIKIQEGKVYIKTNPVQKNLIFMRKDEVLTAINKDFPEIRVSSIVFV